MDQWKRDDPERSHRRLARDRERRYAAAAAAVADER